MRSLRDQPGRGDFGVSQGLVSDKPEGCFGRGSEWENMASSFRRVPSGRILPCLPSSPSCVAWVEKCFLDIPALQVPRLASRKAKYCSAKPFPGLALEVLDPALQVSITGAQGRRRHTAQLLFSAKGSIWVETYCNQPGQGGFHPGGEV